MINQSHEHVGGFDLRYGHEYEDKQKQPSSSASIVVTDDRGQRHIGVRCRDECGGLIEPGLDLSATTMGGDEGTAVQIDAKTFGVRAGDRCAGVKVCCHAGGIARARACAVQREFAGISGHRLGVLPSLAEQSLFACSFGGACRALRVEFFTGEDLSTNRRRIADYFVEEINRFIAAGPRSAPTDEHGAGCGGIGAQLAFDVEVRYTVGLAALNNSKVMPERAQSVSDRGRLMEADWFDRADTTEVDAACVRDRKQPQQCCQGEIDPRFEEAFSHAR